MKTKKKALVITLSAVLLVAVSILGTVAYLTSQDTVVNTFTVGKVDIDLDEADVDEYGVEIPSADRVKGNEYKLVPGHTYVKDPTVTVMKGSEESYIRMLVTINNLTDIKAIFGSDFLPQNYVEGWDNSVWVPAGLVEDASADTVTYEFRYYTTVDAREAAENVTLPALFTKFTLPGEVDAEGLAKLSGEDGKDALQITVVGHAIQKDTFEDANEAWAAFETQMSK